MSEGQATRYHSPDQLTVPVQECRPTVRGAEDTTQAAHPRRCRACLTTSLPALRSTSCHLSPGASPVLSSITACTLAFAEVRQEYKSALRVWLFAVLRSGSP